jgi:hypothetical protein
MRPNFCSQTESTVLTELTSEARQVIWSTKPEAEFKVNGQILKKK